MSVFQHICSARSSCCKALTGAACAALRGPGVGGTAYLPVTVCDSRNVLETADDPYWFESIVVSRAEICMVHASDAWLQLIRFG